MREQRKDRSSSNANEGTSPPKHKWVHAAVGCLGLLVALVAVACDTEQAPDDGPAVEEVEIIGRTISTGLLGTQETLEGSVLVTHPDSLDQLVGGVVRQGDNLLGVLVQVSAGTFSYSIPFQDISSINEGEAGSVTLSVVVLDNDGEMAQDDFELEICASRMLHCATQCVDPEGPDAC